MSNRSMVQIVALVFGAIYLAGGILGFFNHVILAVSQVNLLHNLVHVAIGIGGLAAVTSVANSKTFCRAAGVFLLLLGLIGIGAAKPCWLAYSGGGDGAPPRATAAVLPYFGFAAPVSTRSA